MPLWTGSIEEMVPDRRAGRKWQRFDTQDRCQDMFSPGLVNVSEHCRLKCARKLFNKVQKDNGQIEAMQFYHLSKIMTYHAGHILKHTVRLGVC